MNIETPIMFGWIGYYFIVMIITIITLCVNTIFYDPNKKMRDRSINNNLFAS